MPPESACQLDYLTRKCLSPQVGRRHRGPGREDRALERAGEEREPELAEGRGLVGARKVQRRGAAVADGRGGDVAGRLLEARVSEVERAAEVVGQVGGTH